MNKAKYTVPRMQRIQLHAEGLVAASITIDNRHTINHASEIGAQGKNSTPSIWE